MYQSRRSVPARSAIDVLIQRSRALRASCVRLRGDAHALIAGSRIQREIARRIVATRDGRADR